ncbi:MAG TPA: hypothetical protein VLJ37_06610 [bacterium]|nr:hypothetical protein [bacterium]
MTSFRPIIPSYAVAGALHFSEHGIIAEPPGSDTASPAGRSICHIWNESDRGLAQNGIRTELTEALKDLGSGTGESKPIETALVKLERNHGLDATLRATGWAVLRDGGRGLWPTAAFREAWLAFKRDRLNPDDLKDRALELKRKDDFASLFALSLSCQEVLDRDLRGYIEKSRRVRLDQHRKLVIADDLRPFDDEGFRSLQMVGSYLGGRPDLPWGSADIESIGPAIHSILLKTADEIIEHDEERKRKGDSGLTPRMATWDELYRPAVALDGGHAFRNAVHIARWIREGIWQLPMPVSAARLNIELPCDEASTHLALTARALARLVADGHHISAKFTMSDHRGDFWYRLCIYVPTCAIPATMKAFLPLFYGEKLSWTQNLVDGHFPGEFNILLPRYCSLRGTGEGGVTTWAQFKESLAAVASLGITHQVLRTLK